MSWTPGSRTDTEEELRHIIAKGVKEVCRMYLLIPDHSIYRYAPTSLDCSEGSLTSFDLE